MTGLPTVLGWYVHEWLWRNDTGDLNQKSADIQSIYTSSDEALVKFLIDKYEISYIVVGSREFEKYGDRLNEELLLEIEWKEVAPVREFFHIYSEGRLRRINAEWTDE